MSKRFNVQDNLLTKLDIYGFFLRNIYFYYNLISLIIEYLQCKFLFF